MNDKIIRIFTTIILAVLIGVICTACSDEEPVIESFDQDPPHLVGVTPGDSSSDISVSTPFSVSFDEPMYPETINFSIEDDDCYGSLQVSKDGFKSCVQMSQESFSYNADKQTFFVSPQSPLEGYTTYRIRITESAKDLALNQLAEEFEMTTGFTTGPGSGGPVNNAQKILFGDKNTNQGMIRGYLTVERAEDESGIDGYTLYWGASDNERLGGEGPIQSWSVSEGKLEHYFSDMAIPQGATHFLVYTYNGDGESGYATSRDIPDTILRMVADICPGASTSHSYPMEFAVYAGKLFFTADGCSGDYSELWAYNGVSSPYLVENIGGVGTGSTPGSKVVYNEKLYFSAYTSASGTELWEYDDALSTASQVADIYSTTSSSNPDNLIAFNGNLYFSADDGTNGEEIWYYNATTAGFINVQINPSGGAMVEGFMPYNGRLYFSGFDNTDQDLWFYDGLIPPATVTATNIDYVAAASAVTLPSSAEFYVYNGKLYFTADDGAEGVEPYVYDGSSVNLVLNIHAGSFNSSLPHDFIEYNGILYFSAQNGTGDMELWAHDGTYTWLADDIEPSGSSDPSDLVVYKGMLIFQAESVTYGEELWGYTNYEDPSEAFMIADINPDGGWGSPSHMTIYNDRLYFSADDGTHGTELWVFYVD